MENRVWGDKKKRRRNKKKTRVFSIEMHQGLPFPSFPLCFPPKLFLSSSCCCSPCRSVPPAPLTAQRYPARVLPVLALCPWLCRAGGACAALLFPPGSRKPMSSSEGCLCMAACPSASAQPPTACVHSATTSQPSFVPAVKAKPRLALCQLSSLPSIGAAGPQRTHGQPIGSLCCHPEG